MITVEIESFVVCVLVGERRGVPGVSMEWRQITAVAISCGWVRGRLSKRGKKGRQRRRSGRERGQTIWERDRQRDDDAADGGESNNGL
jgi:hypothetical protein